MALSGITINRGQGGLGRPLTTKDHVSGFIMPFVNANLPSGFTTSDRIKIVYSIAEAVALGITQAGANTNLLWYHLNQFFKKQPQGKLYVHLIDSTAIAYDEIETLQNYAGGEIRQIGYYDPLTAFATATLNSLQTSATTLESEDKPLSVIYAGDFQAVATIGALPDLRALTNKNVSVCVGEDGAGLGSALAISESVSVTCIGALLGAVSFAQVHRNVGHIALFNQVDGTEFDEPAIAIGTGTILVKDQATAGLTTLNDSGYIFLKKYTGIDGSYYNDTPTCIASTSDYANIENNRTIDKAVRNVRALLLPFVNSPLYVNTDGTLTEDVISNYKNTVKQALEQMERDGELSAFSTTIDPTQNVLTTSKIAVSIKIVPVGVAREIEVNIGFAVSV